MPQKAASSGALKLVNQRVGSRRKEARENERIRSTYVWSWLLSAEQKLLYLTASPPPREARPLRPLPPPSPAKAPSKSAIAAAFSAATLAVQSSW